MKRRSFSLHMRLIRGASYGVLLSAGALSLAVCIQACGEESESTGGKRVVLHTRLDVDDAARKTFSTAFGWQVTLTKALVTTGPFYYFDGAPPLVRLDASPRYQRAARWLGLGTVHAHPGHYQEGNALGQMLEGA